MSQFTALDLSVDTRRRRQFCRGLVRQGKAKAVVDDKGRAIYKRSPKTGTHYRLYERE